MAYKLVQKITIKKVKEKSVKKERVPKGKVFFSKYQFDFLEEKKILFSKLQSFKEISGSFTDTIALLNSWKVQGKVSYDMFNIISREMGRI